MIGVADEIKGQVPRGFVGAEGGCIRRRSWLTNWWRRCATRSARWPASGWWTWCPRCRRPGPARSCARRCGHRARQGRAAAVDHRGPGRAGLAAADPAGVSRLRGVSARRAPRRSPQPPRSSTGHVRRVDPCGQVDISSVTASTDVSTPDRARGAGRWSTRMSPTRYAATGCSSGWKPRNGAS